MSLIIAPTKNTPQTRAACSSETRMSGARTAWPGPGVLSCIDVQQFNFGGQTINCSSESPHASCCRQPIMVVDKSTRTASGSRGSAGHVPGAGRVKKAAASTKKKPSAATGPGFSTERPVHGSQSASERRIIQMLDEQLQMRITIRCAMWHSEQLMLALRNAHSKGASGATRRRSFDPAPASR